MIPIFDSKRQYQEIGADIEKAVCEVLRSGAYILGNNTKALEKELAEYTGSKYAIGLNSGTDALHLALRALDIGKGDEVILPDFTMIASAYSVCYTGAKPVFVDCDKDTWNIDVTKIEEKITLLLKPEIENLGYELYDIYFVKEVKDYYLKVFIDKNTGISLDDCETVSNAISDILDKEDPIKEQYFLEVSSTGVEKMIRKDKHLKENIGEYITIKLFKPINNFKEYVGKLKSFDDQIITIEVENEELNIERKNISLIKKYYDWNV